MAESITGLKRTCRIGDLSSQDLGKELILMGFAHRTRDLGALNFIDLRDLSGEVQLVFDQDSEEEIFQKSKKVRAEYVLAARGILRKRSSVNPEIKNGDLELEVKELRILSAAKTPPFYIEEDSDVKESLRLEHRYLDLRRPDMQSRLALRHKLAKITRDYFDEHRFLEIETPFLIVSTPEGARDYLVPSRIFPGKFFALPQSPQIFKQLLMVGGYDRYLQIAKCFRDEDLRADRQPEFTQIDLEMSFVSEEDVFELLEGYMQKLLLDIKGYELKLPLRRMEWQEAMDRFGSDKPDTRFGLELVNISKLAAELDFRVFTDCIEAGGSVRLIRVPGGANFSRREIDRLTEEVKTYGAKGLAYLAFGDTVKGSIIKFVNPEWLEKLKEEASVQNGDLVLIVADQDPIVYASLGHLRLHLAQQMDLIDEESWDLLWVTKFPMFERDLETGRLHSSHHPFTQPLEEDLDLLASDPEAARSNNYDLVMNGNELGSGSVRIHDPEIQSQVLSLLGFSEVAAKAQFGFLLEAFDYGVPPHAGIALGLDRLTMLFSGTNNIRDVIAFPKVQNSSCLLTKAPSEVASSQLDELGISVKRKD